MESTDAYLQRNLLLFLVVFLTLAAPASAGGPKYVAGVSYFNPGTAGTPLTWAQGSISYYTDQGNLSLILPGSSADAFVADAFSQWTTISTAAVSAPRGGQLAEDVSGANVYANPDGTITMPADIMPTATGTPVGVVYDADGSVVDAFLGQGAGDASECFENAVLGWIDNFSADAHFLHALVVINGNCAQASSQLTDVKYRLVRVLGRILGLDWSQVNDNVFTHNPPPTPDDYAGLPVMHAVDPPNCIPITLCYANPYQPKVDDEAALSRLYPITAQNLSTFPRKNSLSASTARIHGSVYFTKNSGQAGQGMQGVNVVARWIDPGTGIPSRSYAVASVSGFLFSGNTGNPATGYDDSNGLPYNQYGSNDTTLEGFFDLAGLQIPNGTTSAQYQLSVEAVDPLWSTAVGPYGPWQVQPSGASPAITVTASLGSDTEQDILMTDSATPAADPFPMATYAAPVAIPLGGDWIGSLSPYGDVDYFWFNGEANTTVSVTVSALDESGDLVESKTQPVIGMWSLSDPGTFPAPANTSSPFNSSFPGMTMLAASLSQTTAFRIGIADVRGDGRPDYRYHARVLYAGQVNPARASAAGGTPLTLSGIGLEPTTTVSIGGQNVLPLSLSGGQMLLAAPAYADGIQNLSVADPATGASSVVIGGLTYGAGPNDSIVLIPSTNPATPVGGQVPNPIRVQVLAPDGITPVAGASVRFTANPSVAFSACSGATNCTVLTDETGQASTLATVVAPGAITVTAQLAPASYPAPKQIQTTLVGTESSLDLALSPQTAHMLQNSTGSLTLTTRVLSSGAPLSGRSVNFFLTKGAASLNPLTATTDANGYATTVLAFQALSGDLQVSACVAPSNNPCVTFYGTSIPNTGLQLQAISGTIQAVAAGQTWQPVVVRVTDFSTPPNSILGASVVFQSSVERSNGSSAVTPAGDTTIVHNPEPVILETSQTALTTDVNGLVSFLPSDAGFGGALQIVGNATAGLTQVPFSIQLLPPLSQ